MAQNNWWGEFLPPISLWQLTVVSVSLGRMPINSTKKSTLLKWAVLPVSHVGKNKFAITIACSARNKMECYIGSMPSNNYEYCTRCAMQIATVCQMYFCKSWFMAFSTMKVIHGSFEVLCQHSPIKHSRFGFIESQAKRHIYSRLWPEGER